MTVRRPEDLHVIRQWAAGDEILLDNVPLRVQGGIGYDLVNVYPRPERQGEPGPADHPYNATHTQRSWVDGQLRRDMLEPAEVAAYWDALAWTDTRGKLGARLKVVKLPEPDGWPGGMVVPHKRVGDHFIYTAGNLNGRIFEYRSSTGQLHDPGDDGAKTFLGTVTNRGVVFRANGEGGYVEGWLYLPSSSGYTRMHTTTYETREAPADHQYLCVGMSTHENKLYRLMGDGVVESIIAHDDDWVQVAVVADGSEPRNIYQTVDDDGNWVIGVTTSSGLFLLDHDNGILWQTKLSYPEHAFQGYGATQWRADDWISVGVGVHRRVGGQITPEGLDNYDGLPSPLAGGFITDLCGSYNWLIAAVSGRLQGSTAEVVPTEEMFGLTTNLPLPIVGKGTAADFLGTNRVGAIFAWNGFGWRKLHQWNRPPTRVAVSMITNPSAEERQQHLFWGDYDGGAYLVQIPSDYYNPQESPSLPLERTWYLEESRLDWNTQDTPKLAKQINIKVDQLYHVLPNGQGPFSNTIQVVCNWKDLDGIVHTSEDPDVLAGDGPYPFVAVGVDGYAVAPLPYLELSATTVAQNSRRAASIGWERYTQSGELLATGLPHEAIWMTYRGVNDPANEYTTGLIEWRSIIGRKWMRPNRIFTFVIDATAAIKNTDEEAALDFLDACCLKIGGVPLVTGDDFYIVDVTRLDGPHAAGLSPIGTRTITCLEFTDITYEDPIPPAG